MIIKVGNHVIGENHPTYFIADIAANHDGNLERAKSLIRLAKEAGADAAKFQNFRANKIVSDYGFKSLKSQLSHQSKWKKSVYEIYESASIPFEWTIELKKECDKVGIDYFSAPYDLEAIDMLEEHVVAYKIGSGDIDWIESIERMAQKSKPVFLATGAATLEDVQRAVHHILKINPNLVLMQCNTNYTASLENFNYINLNVLKSYAALFPQTILGLSDHTPGHSTVLGAVALGARAVEKHFTDDIKREGPDHAFSMDPQTWCEMVDRTRELEKALGSVDKTIASNEKETAIIQRRCLRAARDIQAGEKITRDMVDVLRPSAENAYLPYEINKVIGNQTKNAIPFGKEITEMDF
jgi:sialic acid synthase SpsE